LNTLFQILYSNTIFLKYLNIYSEYNFLRVFEYSFQILLKSILPESANRLGPREHMKTTFWLHNCCFVASIFNFYRLDPSVFIRIRKATRYLFLFLLQHLFDNDRRTVSPTPKHASRKFPRIRDEKNFVAQIL